MGSVLRWASLVLGWLSIRTVYKAVLIVMSSHGFYRELAVFPELSTCTPPVSQ